MTAKPVMVAVPLLALAYDRVFLSSSWKEVFKDRGRVHLGLLSTWILLALLLARIPQQLAVLRSGDIGFQPEALSPVVYVLNQAPIIAHYLQVAHLLVTRMSMPAIRRLHGT